MFAFKKKKKGIPTDEIQVNVQLTKSARALMVGPSILPTLDPENDPKNCQQQRQHK